MRQGVFVGLTLLALGAADAAAQRWGPAGCAAVAAPVWAQSPPLPMASAREPRYEWKRGEDASMIHLVQGGKQLGTWRYDTRRYHELLPGDRWTVGLDLPAGVPAPPPAPTEFEEPASPPPSEPIGAKGDAAPTNFGVDVEAWKREPRRALIQGAGLPDDAHKLRLTVIGSESERKAVLADLEQSDLLRGLKDKVVVQAYPSDHWAVKDLGFKTDGHPTIYCQAPTGKVLHRQDDYTGGAARLAEAIRRADPNYKPEKDPNLGPSLPALPSLPAWLSSPWVAVAGAAVVVYLLTRKGGA